MDASRIAALLGPFLGDATLTDAQLSQFSTYLDLLLHWNARINLTAIRDPEQIVARHFGESLFTGRRLYPNGWRLATGHWLLDLGSGAGFPGLPIEIWAPALRVTLIESQYRKAIFLREVIRALALSNIDVSSTRAEDFDPREQCSPAALGRDARAQHSTRAGPAAPPATANTPSIANRQSSIDNLTLTLRAVEKFHHVLPTAVRLLDAASASTRRLALLIGAAQAPRTRQLLPDLAWSDPILIPQSSHRILLIGAINALPGQQARSADM